jgi:hypothetical protein
VIKRSNASTGVLPVSVPGSQIESVNDALQVMEQKMPTVNLARHVVQLILDDARRLGWKPPKEHNA